MRWIPGVNRELRSSASWFQFGKSVPFITRGTGSKQRQEGKLVNSIKPSTKQSFGEIDTISFSFERHGIFVHKGVGRGWEMTGKLVSRTAKGKIQNGGRNVVEWFNPVIDRHAPDLADQIAVVNADAVVNAAKLKI
ncbi:MAG TPA: hypothetical protein VLQ91_22855 [Draconibacterium sp.]|nr:hypothetical protein [Draconibacterium sp.]